MTFDLTETLYCDNNPKSSYIKKTKHQKQCKNYGGPQLSQQQQITHSTNQDIHNANQEFTAKANDSQHKPKCSQQKENGILRPLDLWDP